MQTTLPVALSGQIATERRLDTIAHNLANMRTAGFRAEEVRFETVLSNTDRSNVSFVSSGERFISTRAGELTATGNDLDIAVSGEGWLAIQGPSGPVYTRDGRMQINQEGELTTLTGRAVLDVGGAPLLLDPNGGAIEIAHDGMITQNNLQVGAVGLFQMQEGTRLSRFDTSAVVPDRAPVPVVEFGDIGVVQRYVEGSNVNAVLEMTRLIEVQRAFEQAATMIESSERSFDSALATLGAQR